MFSFFKDLLDIDNNGELDIGEEMLGAGILGAILEGAEDDDDDDFDEDDDDYDDSNEMDPLEYAELEKYIAVLEEKLAKLLRSLEQLEDKEPDDIESAAYSRWEKRYDELTEEISDTEDEIDEAKDLLND